MEEISCEGLAVWLLSTFRETERETREKLSGKIYT